MPSTLAQFRTRISQALLDTSNVNFAIAAIDEALQTALDDYTGAAPFSNEALLTLPGAGRTIALDSITGLLAVTQIWWPYDSLKDDDVNDAANLVDGFVLRFDDARPIVQLKIRSGSGAPVLNDEIYVWYTKPHTIQNLASSAITTVVATHESGLVTGASGYAALARAIDITETYNQRRAQAEIESWGLRQLATFRAWLAIVHTAAPVGRTKVFGTGWQLDKWDK